MPWKRRKSSQCKVDVAHAQLIQSFELLNGSMKRPSPWTHIAACRLKALWQGRVAGACCSGKNIPALSRMKWHVGTVAVPSSFISGSPIEPR